jgi:Rieske Fe-S protein
MDYENPVRMSHADPCGYTSAPTVNTTRRRVIRIAVAGVAAPLCLLGEPAAAIVPGDRLVEEDAEGKPEPFRVGDLKIGKPVLAYPFDVSSNTARDDSRLNKIVLVRLPEEEMTPATRALSAGGVVAYSAICTHQNCDVKTWLSKEKVLVCYCHSSKFALLDGAAVVGGPAPRPLPAIPLKLDGDLLVIGGPFTASPGGTPP